MSMNGHNSLKRPPGMGEMKRQADAQALTLRAQLKAMMRIRGKSIEDVAAESRLDVDALRAFADGASISPRWQEKLARWLDMAPGE